jgi:hypothetical protein
VYKNTSLQKRKEEKVKERNERKFLLISLVCCFFSPERRITEVPLSAQSALAKVVKIFIASFLVYIKENDSFFLFRVVSPFPLSIMKW